MSSLTPLEKRQFEDLFDMASGAVIDFSHRTLAGFFRDLVQIDIGDKKYLVHGDSKAWRVRTFLAIEDDAKVGKVLKEMLAVWLYNQPDKEKAQSDFAYQECLKTVSRLLGQKQKIERNPEEEFLSKDFGGASIKKLPIEAAVMPLMEKRLKEIEICLNAQAPMAAIFLSGSVLEGILLGAALQAPQKFNQSEASPKKEGKVLQFHEWTLSNFIDVACDIGTLKLDVKKFGHALRDFRNYIHPYQQMSSGFNPDKHTATMCLQVLKAAIADLSGER